MTSESGKYGASQVYDTEKCVIGKSSVHLPQILCEQKAIFDAVLSKDTWRNVLKDHHRSHLMKYLPTFSANDQSNKNQTLQQLFGHKNFKFGNPLDSFQDKLTNGFYTPAISKANKEYQKARFTEYKRDQNRYYFKVLQDVLRSKQKLLEAASNVGPMEPIKIERHVATQSSIAQHALELKVKRRYFYELQQIREEIGDYAADTSSEDENYRGSSALKLSKKQRRNLAQLETTLGQDMDRVHATFTPLSLDLGPAALGAYDVNEDDYWNMLKSHKKRRSQDDLHPELDTTGLTLQDIVVRCSITCSSSQTTTAPSASKKPRLESASKKPIESKPKRKRKPKVVAPPAVETENAVDVPISIAAPLEVKIETKHSPRLLEVVKPESPKVSPVVTPPLLHGNFACFFSLVRDIIGSGREHRISTEKLQKLVALWQDMPLSALNDWYGIHLNWQSCVENALMFLAGEMKHDINFVPFIERKEMIKQWQWIGAGRDSDTRMNELCQKWFNSQTDLFGESLQSADLETLATELHSSNQDRVDGLFLTEALLSPPTVPVVSYQKKAPPQLQRKSSKMQDRLDYQRQEKLRYENPHKAFTYTLNGYNYVVGPVKGIYSEEILLARSTTKARGHAFLLASRPNFITILCLVRDAVARMPNAEGSKNEICDLLRDSQYVLPIPDGQLTTVVSGALDRLHYEKNPCVMYDAGKKTWIYQHRHMSEEDFNRVHDQQHQRALEKKANRKPRPDSGDNPPKRKPPSNPRKPRKKDIVAASASQPPSLLIQSQAEQNELDMAIHQIEEASDPLPPPPPYVHIANPSMSPVVVTASLSNYSQSLAPPPVVYTTVRPPIRNLTAPLPISSAVGTPPSVKQIVLHQPRSINSSTIYLTGNASPNLVRLPSVAGVQSKLPINQPPQGGGILMGGVKILQNPSAIVDVKLRQDQHAVALGQNCVPVVKNVELISKGIKRQESLVPANIEGSFALPMQQQCRPIIQQQATATLIRPNIVTTVAASAGRQFQLISSSTGQIIHVASPGHINSALNQKKDVQPAVTMLSHNPPKTIGALLNQQQMAVQSGMIRSSVINVSGISTRPTQSTHGIRIISAGLPQSTMASASVLNSGSTLTAQTLQGLQTIVLRPDGTASTTGFIPQSLSVSSVSTGNNPVMARVLSSPQVVNVNSIINSFTMQHPNQLAPQGSIRIQPAGGVATTMKPEMTTMPRFTLVSPIATQPSQNQTSLAQPGMVATVGATFITTPLGQINQQADIRNRGVAQIKLVPGAHVGVSNHNDGRVVLTPSPFPNVKTIQGVRVLPMNHPIGTGSILTHVSSSPTVVTAGGKSGNIQLGQTLPKSQPIFARIITPASGLTLRPGSINVISAGSHTGQGLIPGHQNQTHILTRATQSQPVIHPNIIFTSVGQVRLPHDSTS